MRNLRLSTDYVRSIRAQRLIVTGEFAGSHPPTGGMGRARIDIQIDANPRAVTKSAYRADASFRRPFQCVATTHRGDIRRWVHRGGCA